MSASLFAERRGILGWVLAGEPFAGFVQAVAVAADPGITGHGAGAWELGADN